MEDIEIARNAKLKKINEILQLWQERKFEKMI